jgi:hypothetical protein
MNELLAHHLIPSRMQELGFSKHYLIVLEHLVLKGNERIELSAYNEFYYLVKQAEDLRIVSDFGFYDLGFAHTNGQDYEHQGQIVIHNHSPLPNHVLFLHVIPKH